MTAVKDVTGTAFIVAEFRADGNSEDEPLYRDEIVKLFLDADTKKAADSFSSDFPAIKRLVQIRTCYFDDRLDEQIRRGVRQIVILGAGFDTRPIRKQTSSVTYFEVDDPSTLDLKQVRLAAEIANVEITHFRRRTNQGRVPWSKGVARRARSADLADRSGRASHGSGKGTAPCVQTTPSRLRLAVLGGG
jgi:Leucine carboxyl methyltransferase